MSIRDNEMHVVASVGACVLTAALFIPAAVWAGGTGGSSSDDDNAKNKVVVEASLAARKTPKSGISWVGLKR